MTRDKKTYVRLTDEEYKVIQHKADKIGQTVSGYLRYLGLTQKDN